MFSCSCVCLQHIIEFTVLHTSDLQTIKRLEAAYILAGFTLQIIPIRIISKQRSHVSEMFKKHRTYCYLRLKENGKMVVLLIITMCNWTIPSPSPLWRRHDESRGSFPGILLRLKYKNNAFSPHPGLKSATKVDKSRAMPTYVPGVTPRDCRWQHWREVAFKVKTFLWDIN